MRRRRAACGSRLRPPRAIASLEARLGARVFARTTRSVSLTEAGARLLQRARDVLEAVEMAELEAAGRSAEPAGHLVVTAPVTFGRKVLRAALPVFLERRPST